MVQGLELLERLCQAFGPSGCEGNVADIIKEEIDGLYDELITDRLYDVIAVYKGNGVSDKKLMLSAHMDEVGFMVTSIDDDGYIRFCNVGGIDPRVICGRKVTFGNEGQKITGIVASKPVHLQDDGEKSNATPVDKMYVDIGAKNKEETQKYVNIGDFGTFCCDFVRYGTNMLRAKAIDDRFGCAVMIEILRKLKSENKRLDFDIYFAFTVREEIGMSGAKTASYKINPDKAIVLEATAVADIFDVKEPQSVAKTGEGAAISMLDNGTIYDADFVKFALECGKRNNIKCQIKHYVSGGNDAAHIQKIREGVKTLAISNPTRYIHTPSNVINIDDYFAVQALVYAVICELDINF